MKRNSRQVKNVPSEETLRDGFREGEKTQWAELYGMQGKSRAQSDR